ncbi:hypothetical protein ENSA5_05820 [Enhygromyxa salina]|uniref:L,D-TPase catalytic domain-containing protein n=1 Tax=Enhygromyxa salina TaxID=215803 RepID=A0A2S9YHT5_9BACT|nr:L,D-transpeptidase [Enhygromyxa salina]PRQ04668.1 hypothetical protein ENSA5_05820 [Enhygromyxa salina]
MARLALASTVAIVAIGLACHTDATSRPRAQGEHSAADAAPPDSVDDATSDPAADREPAERTPYTPPSTLGQPSGIRLAKRSRMVYAAPDHDALVRGRIPSKQTFHVFEEREAPGCDRPWARVAEAAWVCLERTERSEVEPAPMPALADGATLPYLYARHEHHDDPATPAIPVYSGISAYRERAAPVDSLPAYGSYAFTRYRHNHGDPVFVTLDRRVVPAAGLDPFKPSEFGGRELLAQPIAPGETLAWAVRWQTWIRAAPDLESERLARVTYHHTLSVVGEGVLGPGEDGEAERWMEVPATERAPSGWVRAHDVRRFVPVPPPDPILGGQVTVDVDLDEQVLSVWVEDTPVFATLISSGKRNDETPPGLYRIETKRAYGKMQSMARARDPYFVEAVPWAMYFRGRYALHAAYWHDMFGHRMSHGCVNLSPRDAKRVFELATPTLPGGWLIVHEHPSDPGALVRVRRAGHASPDHRGALELSASQGG